MRNWFKNVPLEIDSVNVCSVLMRIHMDMDGQVSFATQVGSDMRNRWSSGLVIWQMTALNLVNFHADLIGQLDRSVSGCLCGHSYVIGDWPRD